MLWFTLILPAITLGLLSSFHCLGMCGPIAFVLPINQRQKSGKAIGISLYNLGRITTYSLFGLLIGLFGEGLRFIGISQIISVILGTLLIVYVIFSKKLININIHNKTIYHFNAFVRTKLGIFLTKKSNISLYLLGLLNGLIPCGVVFIALQGALLQNNIIDSILFMTVFGIGTIPMLFGVSYLSNVFKPTTKIKINKVMPYITIVIALLLILRGANLNIPYLSPSYNIITNEMKCCHKSK